MPQLDSDVSMPKSGELDFTVSFAPLPSTIKSFAFSVQGQVLLMKSTIAYS